MEGGEMKGRRVFQRQYEKDGEREHKLTLNLLLPHLSVNFTLVSFFVLIFQCDSIDCPLLLHKRIQRVSAWVGGVCWAFVQTSVIFGLVLLRTLKMILKVYGLAKSRSHGCRQTSSLCIYYVLVVAFGDWVSMSEHVRSNIHVSEPTRLYTNKVGLVKSATLSRSTSLKMQENICHRQ